MYYVNEFNKPSTDEWQYAIWKIKRVSENTIIKFRWIKKIYDPVNRFKIGEMHTLTSSVLKSNEHEVIQRIFEGK